MAFSTTTQSNEISFILMNIEQYEFEDIKQIQTIFVELHNNFSDLIEDTLHPHRHEIIKSLLDKYTLPGMATFIGIFLRFFTKTSVHL